MKGGIKLTPTEKNYPQKPALLGLTKAVCISLVLSTRNYLYFTLNETSIQFVTRNTSIPIKLN